MTKFEMVCSIAEKSGVEQQIAKQIVQMTLDGIIDVLATEGRLELREFGVFEVRLSPPRQARNPRTGATVQVPARKWVAFKTSKIMAERVNTSPGQV